MSDIDRARKFNEARMRLNVLARGLVCELPAEIERILAAERSQVLTDTYDLIRIVRQIDAVREEERTLSERYRAEQRAEYIEELRREAANETPNGVD